MTDPTPNSLTPPPELVEEWFMDQRGLSEASRQHITTQAARWGADQELEACAQWVEANFGQLPTHNLHQFRRPKPPSLKEQAFAAFKNSPVDSDSEMLQLSADAELIIRRALEQLDG